MGTAGQPERDRARRAPHRLGRALRRLCLATLLILTGAIGVALPPLPAHGVASSTTRLDWGSRAPMPTARHEFGLVAAPNGRLYAVGGLLFTSSVTTVEEYDPATNTWATRAPLPTARNALGMAAAPNGRLYAIGGFDNGIRNEVEEYDPATNTWTAKAPMLTPRYSLGLAAAPNGRLYAIGGHAGTSSVGTVEEYDPATNTWATKAPMPTGRSALALAAAPNGKLYAIGGFNNGRRNEVEEYNPTTNTWTTKALMPTARETLGLAAAPNGRLYAVGGNGPNNVVEEYDPTINAWATKAPMPTARNALALAAAPNGRLYAIGGFINEPRNEVEEYDPAANAWARAPAREPLPSPARQQAATAVAGGRLYVFGGADANGNRLADVREYDPATNTWRPVDPMPTLRYGAAAATAPNGRIYVVGAEIPGTGQLALLEEFTPPTNGVGIGSWRTAPDVAQPQVGRVLAGFAVATNGKLYAAGGFGPQPGSSFVGPRNEVEEYDPAANAWRLVSPMAVARHSLGLTVAGDGKLYAVGGTVDTNGGLNSAPTAAVERFTPPTDSSDPGIWAGPSGIPPLPAARSALGLVGTPSGNLYALGGASPTSDANTRDRPEVYEYDPVGNAWATKAPMPSARRALSVVLVGGRLFAIAGLKNDGVLSVNEEAVLDRLPTVAAGGPYMAVAGGSVQLQATGNDPDGDPLGFAWDVDGDLLYETAGQNPAATVPRKPSGAYPVRVRVLDPRGGYAVATATLNIFCGPRPPVGIRTERIGAGQIRATVTAGLAPLGLLRLGQPRPIQNARVDIQGGPQGITAAQDVTVSGAEAILTVTRRPDAAPTAAVTVPLQVIDGCTPGLPWSTFVGFGSGV
jgi:N-acetylneuraminic acid mutarotase